VLVCLASAQLAFYLFTSIGITQNNERITEVEKMILSKTTTKIIFLVLFTALALVGMDINFSKLVGAENQFFTFFQFFGPISGGFLGAGFGVAAVLLAQLINFVLAGKELTLINVVRLLPMLFAAYYFAKNKERMFDDKLSILVPLVAIIAFIAHPIGAQVWYFSLYWLIPIIVKFLPDRLILRSLGATFTAHAVGGAFWIWAVPMTAEQWNMLIPVVAYERALFALGITISYVVFANILSALDRVLHSNISKAIDLDKRYVYLW
jgi:hypothetical protein